MGHQNMQKEAQTGSKLIKLGSDIALELLLNVGRTLEGLLGNDPYIELKAFVSNEDFTAIIQGEIIKNGLGEFSIELPSDEPEEPERCFATYALSHLVYVWNELGQKIETGQSRYVSQISLDTAISRKVNLASVLDSISSAGKSIASFEVYNELAEIVKCNGVDFNKSKALDESDRHLMPDEVNPDFRDVFQSALKEALLGERMNAGRKLPRKNFKTKILTSIVLDYFKMLKERPSFEYVLEKIAATSSGEGGLIADSEDIDFEARKIYFYPNGYKDGAIAKSVTFERVNNQISEIYKKITS